MVKTLRIKYTSSEKSRIKDIQRQYTSTLKITFNRVEEAEGKISTKELTEKQKIINNNPLMDSHFKNSAIYEAKSVYSSNKDKKVIFRKSNFLDRAKGKISREEFLENKYLPICSVGEADKKGNRKFEIISEFKILFKVNRNLHIDLNLCNLNSNYRKELLQLINAQNNKSLPITYKLDSEYIYISYEEKDLKEVEKINKIKDRVFAIDLNPNYIGWSVVDWKNSDKHELIASGVISIKDINDKENPLKGKSSDSKEKKYIANKRQYETIQVAIYLISLAKHYQCSLFVLEKLDMNSKDYEKGKKFNRLVNNLWNRNLLINQIKKRCDLLDIDVLEVLPNFSSFIGNMVYRNLDKPDMVLASIEIGRRGYEFYHQYIAKDKPKSKNIIFNESESTKTQISQSMEELGLKENFTNIKDLYFRITKTLKLRYRVSSNFDNLKFFSLKSIKSRIILYNSV